MLLFFLVRLMDFTGNISRRRRLGAGKVRRNGKEVRAMRQGEEMVIRMQENGLKV